MPHMFLFRHLFLFFLLVENIDNHNLRIFSNYSEYIIIDSSLNFIPRYKTVIFIMKNIGCATCVVSRGIERDVIFN